MIKKKHQWHLQISSTFLHNYHLLTDHQLLNCFRSFENVFVGGNSGACMPSSFITRTCRFKPNCLYTLFFSTIVQFWKAASTWRSCRLNCWVHISQQCCKSICCFCCCCCCGCSSAAIIMRLKLWWWWWWWWWWWTMMMMMMDYDGVDVVIKLLT